MTVQYTYKVMLLGPAAVGKTSLLHRFVKNEFGDYRSTIGVDFMIKELKLGVNNVKLTIWDIGGQKRFKSMHKQYYANAKGALILFDLTRKETFNEMEEWHSEMVSILKDNVPFLLIGNKSDLIEEKGRAVEKGLAEEFAKQRGSIYTETSAKSGDHVKEAFDELTFRMIKKYDDIIRVQD